jgi:3-hydroxymyristoyl/3-hydroxydecanoyl-(acyl carrier protein) dehydratase
MHEFSATAQIAADHPCLAGHFPGRPVVPAVLLLELVAEALQAQIGGIGLRNLPSVKFLRPLLPLQPLQLQFRADLELGRASFRCECDGTLVARGELRFIQTAGIPAGAAP